MAELKFASEPRWQTILPEVAFNMLNAKRGAMTRDKKSCSEETEVCR